MSYNILYNDNITADMLNLLAYINDFTKGLGETQVQVDIAVCRSIILGMRQDFPHVDGLESASAFKKVANFAVFFIGDRPIQSPFSTDNIGKLAKISNHQNVIVALHLAIDSLHGAVINTKDGKSMELKNRIQLSKHSYCDIVDALHAATPATHFKMLAVLFEQMAYKVNESCQYPVAEL